MSVAIEVVTISLFNYAYSQIYTVICLRFIEEIIL